MYCKKCGEEISENAGFCPKCGENQNRNISHEKITTKKPSIFWYILPIIFSILGGIIGYFALRNKDKSMAKNILYIGIVIFMLPLFSAFIFGMPPEASETSADTTIPAIETKDVGKEIVSTSFNSDYGTVYCSIAATDLQKETLFDDKFKGKYVKWTGTVSSVSETWGDYTLQVKHCPDTFTSDVLITMRDDQKDKLLQLREGERVTYIAKMNRYGEILGLSAGDGEII